MSSSKIEVRNIGCVFLGELCDLVIFIFQLSKSTANNQLVFIGNRHCKVYISVLVFLNEVSGLHIFKKKIAAAVKIPAVESKFRFYVKRDTKRKIKTCACLRRGVKLSKVSVSHQANTNIAQIFIFKAGKHK